MPRDGDVAGREDRHPGRDVLSPAAIGVEQKKTIAALRHVDAEPDEADGAVAQIVTLPAALGDAGDAEQRAGNLAIARIAEPAVERAQGEDKPVPARWRQCRGIVTGVSAGQAAPETKRGGGANLEELVKRQEDSERSVSIVEMYTQRGATALDKTFGIIGGGAWLERHGGELKSGIGKLSRQPRQCDHARERLRRPEN